MGPGLGGGRERRVIPFLFNTNNHLQPILEFFIHYVGSAEEAAPYLKPFQDLSPLYPNGQYYAYPDVLDATGTGLNSPMCQDGHTNMQFPLA